jgi:predicted O-methyltransferase YrrM
MGVNFYQIGQYLRHFLVAKRNGHGVHSPFVYALCENVFYSQERYYDFDNLHRARLSLLNNETELQAGNFGAGSKVFKSGNRKVKDIAARGISTPQQSELLYRLGNYLGITTSIELGTSIGLNSLYLASQNPSGTVYTLEGSTALSEFASQLATKERVGNIEFLTGDFNKLLPAAMELVNGKTLVYIDGDHSYDATYRYFNMLLPLAKDQNVFVFDDIYWSEEMTRAWREISAHPAVRLSIDTFYSGYLFFQKDLKEKINYNLLV